MTEDDKPRQTPPRLLAAPPNTFVLFARPFTDDHVLQQWYVETVVGFDANDGAAYFVGGMNRTGQLTRVADVLSEGGFKLIVMWEDDYGRDHATEWAEQHIKTFHEDALPFERDDPRRESAD